jgi:hypothetical protein
MIKLFFDQRGDPYQEKWPKFFFFKYGQITHQSIDLVELEYDLPKFFSLFFDQIWTFNYSKFSAEFKSFLQNSVCFSSSKRIQILVSLISENQLYVIF